MSIKITVRVNSKGKENAPVAFASAEINDAFIVDGIKVWKNLDKKSGQEILNVQMPGQSNKGKERTFYNPHFKYNSPGAQTLLETEVLEAYARATTPEKATA